MIVEKRSPSLRGRLAVTAHVVRHGALGDLDDDGDTDLSDLAILLSRYGVGT